MPKLYDLAAMKARLAAIDEERNPLVRMIQAVEAYEGTVGETILATDNVTVRKAPTPGNDGAKPPTVIEQTENVAIEQIEATGRPVQTRKVLDIMTERGLPLPNKNHINVISARLSNSSRLEGRRGFGWWYRDKPWPGDPQITFEPLADGENTEGESMT